MAGRIAGVLVGLLVGALVSPAAAQSLADVARKEAARREQLKASGKATESKLLTNADLPASAVVAPQGAPASGEAAPASDDPSAAKSPSDAASTPAAAAATLAAKSDEGTPAAPTDDEAGWRARAERVNSALAAARTQVRQLKGLSDRLSLEVQATDPAIVSRAQAEWADLKAQIAAAEQKESAALADRQALEQEARVAGVLPAWIQ